jgi:hypothetical protein
MIEFNTLYRKQVPKSPRITGAELLRLSKRLALCLILSAALGSLSGCKDHHEADYLKNWATPSWQDDAGFPPTGE